MAWGLEEENGDVYVVINGKKAISIDTHDEYGKIEFVDHGRTADEIWIRFAGSKQGKRLLRSKYSPCSENVTLKELENSQSTSDFIKKLEAFSIGKKKITPTKGKKRRSNRTAIPEASGIASPKDTVLSYEQEIVHDKKVGCFQVKERRLTIAPDEYRCRNIDGKWVATLKKSIRQAPGRIITTLPALLDPSVVKDPAEFKKDNIEDLGIPIFLLGGNHLLTACREIMQEEPANDILSEYQNFEIELYVGLTPEEAKLVGNIHNQRCSTKTLHFQDQVRQARSIYLRDEVGDQWKDTTAVILSHIQQKECLKSSLSIVYGVASYSEQAYREVERIFELFGSLDVPKQLFRALLGFGEDIITRYLRNVEIPHDLKKVTDIVLKEKKRDVLKSVFLKRTGCESWEMAEELYEPYISAVDDYIDMNVNRKYIPTGFIRACDAARDSLPAQNITVSVSVTVEVDGEELEDRQVEAVCGEEKRKFESVVKMKVKKNEC
ncbi:uncharacterized protein LOC134237876 [Saccostrea cucullata]|uniref:uncharacterized protein LOC134237876 n=1 Tax=Saccostrea cuccullata TaxID=36930 RepID=UPI002ED49941